jgi:D-alanine-D-alanine ligase
MNNIKPKIALIAGGYSGEYQISVKSASVIMQNIDVEKYDVFLVSITSDKWSCLYEDKEYLLDKNDFSFKLGEHKIKFDLAFIMIHGTPGEDGVLQGYFDMLGIPYTTCNATVSSLTFNKYFCNRVMQTFGANISPSFRVCKNKKYDVNEIAIKVGFPCFVKPNAGGSSIGMSKVYEINKLNEAIELAMQEDDEVLIEYFISGIEVTSGVICTENKIISLPLTEIASKNDFFDFQAKYNSQYCEEITPARIDDKLTAKIKKMSETFYEFLNCKGVVRFDYIVDNEKVWFLEVNTVPGMSAESIIPQQAKVYGWSYKELTTKIIDEGLKNFVE